MLIEEKIYGDKIFNFIDDKISTLDDNDKIFIEMMNEQKVDGSIDSNLYKSLLFSIMLISMGNTRFVGPRSTNLSKAMIFLISQKLLASQKIEAALITWLNMQLNELDDMKILLKDFYHNLDTYKIMDEGKDRTLINYLKSKGKGNQQANSNLNNILKLLDQSKRTKQEF